MEAEATLTHPDSGDQIELKSTAIRLFNTSEEDKTKGTHIKINNLTSKLVVPNQVVT